METDAGVELTEEEVKLIKSMQRLAKKWKKTTNRLWLFSAAGTLNVMMYGDTQYNKRPEMNDRGSVNQDNCVTTIDIPNDGGDW